MDDKTKGNGEAKVNEAYDIKYNVADWEDALIETMAQKHNIDEDVVLDIAVTFLLNEASAIRHKRPNILATVNALDFLKLGPTSRSSMKTLKPTEFFVVGGRLCKAQNYPTIVTSGEHNGEFSIEDTNGNIWYESDFENDIKVLTPEDVEKFDNMKDAGSNDAKE